MANAPSESERQYYEAQREKTAKEIVKVGKPGREADALIDAILNSDDLHEKHKERFRKEVYRRVDELKQKSKDDRETKIIEEYEGKLQSVDGKMRPAGVQEGFNVRVRAGKFEVGNIGRRIWGHSIDGDKLASILDEVKKLEDDIEKNKVELEMLKAARKATATLIGSEKLDMTFGVTKASLVKDIYKNKMKSKGWTSIFSTEATLWDSYKAARDLKEAHEKEYREEGKKKIVALEKEEKQLATRKAILDAALQRVEKLRENGRDLFNSAFGQQLQVLTKNRELMDDDDYNRHVTELRKKVADFGKNAGIVHMDYFLDEALGNKPLIRKSGEKVIYAEPQTEVDKGMERVRVGKWWKENLGKDATEGDITSIITALRKDDPAFLSEIVKAESSEDNRLTANVMKFLFTGKIGDKDTLASGRRAKPSAETTMKYLKVAKSISAEYKGRTGELEDVFTKYAEQWPSEYGAEDFEYIYKVVDKGIVREDVNKKRMTEVSKVWERFTGQSLVDKEGNILRPDVADQLVDAINADTRIKGGPNLFLESLDGVSPTEANFIKFFFSRKFDGDTYLTIRRFRITPKNFLDAYHAVHDFFAESKPTNLELKEICKLIKDRNDESADKIYFKETWRPEAFNGKDFKKSLEKALTEKVRKKDDKKKKK